MAAPLTLRLIVRARDVLSVALAAAHGPLPHERGRLGVRLPAEGVKPPRVRAPRAGPRAGRGACHFYTQPIFFAARRLSGSRRGEPASPLGRARGGPSPHRTGPAPRYRGGSRTPRCRTAAARTARGRATRCGAHTRPPQFPSVLPRRHGASLLQYDRSRSIDPGHSCAVTDNKKSDHNTTHEHASLYLYVVLWSLFLLPDTAQE
jgi:hypothetical protein